MKPSHSHLVRIASNYARLAGNVIAGFFLVRVLLRFGGDAYGLIALLGSSTGLVLVFKEVIRAGTIPELGAAYHDKDPNRLAVVFNSALKVSVATALVTLLFYCLLAACIPFFKIPEELHFAARVFVIVMGVHSFVAVALSPLFNFLAVSERMVTFNLFIFLTRLVDLLAAILAIAIFSVQDISTAVIGYAVFLSVLSTIVIVCGSFVAYRNEPRLKIDSKLATKEAAKSFVSTAGWNGVVTLAMNLYSRVDMIIMNLFFGLFGNLIFGFSNQATFYIRRIMTGMVGGIDSVSARVSGASGKAGIVKLLKQSTNHQAIVVFPVMFLLVLFAEPFVQFWVGDRVENFEKNGPIICLMIRILAVGVTARSLSDGWLKIMSGEGSVKQYAPAILVGGVLNPILAVLAILLAPLEWKLFSAAFVFSFLLVATHLFAIPLAMRKRYSMTLKEIYSPIIAPLVASITCLTVAWLIGNWVSASFENRELARVVSTVLSFGITYLLICYFFVFRTEDRNKILRLMRLRRKSAKLV